MVRGLLATCVHQDFVSPKDWFKVPADAIVSNSQTKKIEKHVEHLTPVGLGSGAVVVFVFCEMIDDGFEDDCKPLFGLSDREFACLDGIEKWLDFGAVLIFHRQPQPVSDPLV